MITIENYKSKRSFFWITLLFTQNNYHKYGVLLHTLKVVYGVLKDRNYKFLAAAFLHDIGKPFVAYQKPQDKIDNIYSFTNHEEKSYQIIENWLFISDWTKQIVRYHFLIIDMKRKKENNNIKMFKKLEKDWVNLTPNLQEDLRTFLKYDNYGKV